MTSWSVNTSTKRKAGSLIAYILTGVAGVARPGHYCSRANKSATPLNIKLSVARCSRLPQMMACRCRCHSSSSSDGGLLLATGLVEPGLWARSSTLRSASNCEQEAQLSPRDRAMRRVN